MYVENQILGLLSSTDEDMEEVVLKESSTGTKLSIVVGKNLFQVVRFDKKSILIEKIKSTIINLILHTEENIKVNFSCYLSEKLNHNYTYLANLFSEVQGITIEHFIINHKVEKIKELMIYSDLTITEIAYKMNYSSVAHLSTQFKKVTGLSPSHFKNLKVIRRTPNSVNA